MPFLLKPVFRPIICVLVLSVLIVAACSDDSSPMDPDAGEDRSPDTQIVDEDASEDDLDATGDPLSDVGGSADTMPADTSDSGTPDEPTNDIGGADTGAGDTGTTDTGPTDTGPADTGVPTVDTGQPDSGSADTGTVDTGATDAGATDAGALDTGESDPYTDRPTGQCVVSSDCPEGPMGSGQCSRTFPGGACNGCGNDSHCPGSTTCLVGVCITECTSTDDCAPGLRCSSTNRCQAKSCVDDECPVPLFGCTDSGICGRIDCSSDDSLCPDDTTCVSGLCIEDRAL